MGSATSNVLGETHQPENFLNPVVVVAINCQAFERLTDDLGDVARQLGIELPALPRAKGGIRKPGLHYRDQLDDADRTKIARVFAREIALLGYEF